MDIKEHIARDVGARAESLIALSMRIHSHPETAWEEHRAAAWTAEMLDAGGLDVTAVTESGGHQPATSPQPPLQY
jgi:metal-dependent amidase/aminoacylase/carboxypeptidase family protein